MDFIYFEALGYVVRQHWPILVTTVYTDKPPIFQACMAKTGQEGTTHTPAPVRVYVHVHYEYEVVE